MLVKSLTKELERIKKKIIKLDKKRLILVHKKHKIKSLIDIEEMKERNKHEIHNK